MAEKKSAVIKKAKRAPSKRKSARKPRASSPKIKKIRAEPTISVKREVTPSFQTITDKVSLALGIDSDIIRVLFIISFIFLIGIPVYLLLSLFMKD